MLCGGSAELSVTREMLPVQSSLAESVDGEDVRSEEDGGEERTGGHYYCLYQYTHHPGGVSQQTACDDDDEGGCAADISCGDDFSLSLVDTNLSAEAEPKLRSFIAKRLSRGAVFEGIGNVASVDLGSPEYTLGCYYCLIPVKAEELAEPGPPTPEHIICFLGGSEKGLDLFRLELDSHVEGLKSKLEPQMGNLESEVRPHLSSWFEDSVLPIHRVVKLFQEKLAFLLHASLSYTLVNVVNSTERTQNDISRFQSSASLQGLVQEGTMTSLCIAMTERQQQPSITVDFRDSQPEMGNAVSNRFCEDWMQVFVNAYDRGSPFLLRQTLENFKLKVIQDMNNMKRLIRQAESSHYALFRCYNFLKNCGNGDILLQIVKVEHAEMPEARSVVTVLEEFIHEEGFSVHNS
ncbi:protein Njmu-R1 [Dendropsophus ebraccatus]|uniref:protein Njmu-R1 n=1 Tax=Dendropsophus ebraccatus TaxID=150705 RepID=UPI003831EA27